MKKFVLMFFLAVAGMAVANAQSAQACCAGKDKAACTKEGAAKAACCAKADAAGCAKASAASTSAGNAKAVAVAGGISTETFTVYGNCGMCKRKIEGALSEVKGIQEANWDMGTKAMTVKYDAGAVRLDDIKAMIAAVGYDSDTHRAPDEVYNNLHGCCQYERPKG